MKKTSAKVERRKRNVAARFARVKIVYRWLIYRLGNKCARCGENNPTLMSIDHPDGINWDRRKLRYDARILKYLQEYIAGVRLRVLCIPCNSELGQMWRLNKPPF